MWQDYKFNKYDQNDYSNFLHGSSNLSLVPRSSQNKVTLKRNILSNKWLTFFVFMSSTILHWKSLSPLSCFLLIWALWNLDFFFVNHLIMANIFYTVLLKCLHIYWDTKNFDVFLIKIHQFGTQPNSWQNY